MIRAKRAAAFPVPATKGCPFLIWGAVELLAQYRRQRYGPQGREHPDEIDHAIRAGFRLIRPATVASSSTIDEKATRMPADTLANQR